MTKPKKPDGVLVVDKPRGPTSHDVVARVRKALATRHVGHTGTLDPMATGVLVLAIGEATKLVPWLTAADKAYDATLRLGTETDTLDTEGQIVASAPVPDEVIMFASLSTSGSLGSSGCSSDLIERALASERARTTQVPPAFSAIRVDGVRAHELARAGRLEEALPARGTEVRSLTLTQSRIDDEGHVEIHLRVEASKGYFVRSLARDFARALGTVGHLTALRRVRSGAFALDDAIALDDVRRESLLTITQAATRALPVTVIASSGLRAVGYGQRVLPEHMTDPHPSPSAWIDESQSLLAIGECDGEGFGRVLRGFLVGQPTIETSETD